MRKILFAFFGILLPIFSSCVEVEMDIDKFTPIKIAYSSIELTATSSKFKMAANVPASGASFYVVPEEKYKDYAYVEAITVDGVEQEREGDFSGEPPYFEYVPILNGEWGRVEFKLRQPRDTVKVYVNPNTSQSSRVIEIMIGHPLTYVNLLITQEGAVE